MPARCRRRFRSLLMGGGSSKELAAAEVWPPGWCAASAPAASTVAVARPIAVWSAAHPRSLRAQARLQLGLSPNAAHAVRTALATSGWRGALRGPGLSPPRGLTQSAPFGVGEGCMRGGAPRARWTCRTRSSSSPRWSGSALSRPRWGHVPLLALPGLYAGRIFRIASSRKNCRKTIP